MTATVQQTQRSTTDESIQTRPGPQGIADQLSTLLAETYNLFNTTQMAHWNVEGPHFAALHELFEKQYNDLVEAIDQLAERVRALGFYVSGGLPQIIESIAAPPAPVTGSEERLLEVLIRQHEKVMSVMRPLVSSAQGAGDDATADLVIKRMGRHDEALWMLRSSLRRQSSKLT